MNLSKKATVVLTLAVAFMMLVTPLSTALGGGYRILEKQQSERRRRTESQS